MEPVKLGELLTNVVLEYVSSHILFNRFIVKSISTDTRSLKKKELFIALKGEKYDAGQFLDRAVELGSSCVIFEIKDIKRVKKIENKNSGVLFIGVKDTLEVYSEMAKNYLMRFKNLKKLAITGSSGKTTTRGLIASVLSAKYSTISNIKSYNNLVGVSKTIFSINSNHDFYIQEMGTNHPGEIAILRDIVNPEAAFITNIGPAHIGFFGSIENIAKEKKEIFLGLNQNNLAFINKDDSFANFLKQDIKARIVYFGLKGYREIKIEALKLDSSIFNFNRVKINLKLPGRHNVLNAVGAIVVGSEFGVTIDEARERLENYKPEEGRGIIKNIRGIYIIDESYNANPLSVKTSIDYLSTVENYGRKFLILGDMAELGSFSEKYHREVAHYLENVGIDFLYLIGNETLYTKEECLRGRIKSIVDHFDDFSSLIKQLIKQLQTGDIILVKGSRIMGLDRLIDNLISELNRL